MSISVSIVEDDRKTREGLVALLRRASGVRLLGPVPAAMHKRAGRYHAQLLIESRERRALHAFLDEWLPQVEQLKSARAVRWSLDVDPVELY